MMVMNRFGFTRLTKIVIFTNETFVSDTIYRSHFTSVTDEAVVGNWFLFRLCFVFFFRILWILFFTFLFFFSCCYWANSSLTCSTSLGSSIFNYSWTIFRIFFCFFSLFSFLDFFCYFSSSSEEGWSIFDYSALSFLGILNSSTSDTYIEIKVLFKLRDFFLTYSKSKSDKI